MEREPQEIAGGQHQHSPLEAILDECQVTDGVMAVECRHDGLWKASPHADTVLRHALNRTVGTAVARGNQRRVIASVKPATAAPASCEHAYVP
ncbi:MAG: hypothetical protein WBV77_03910 [Solirubrobacteraceae bacterium]